MKWKLFLTACGSVFLVSFPQNMIGCGPGIDPYDYYTSFFHPGLPGSKTYQPFYYTGYRFLYDENEPVQATDILAKEWAAYAGAPVTARDAKEFVTAYALKDLDNLYYHIEKAQPLKLPDSVKRNSMTGYFLQQKDMEALGYIMYAKRAEQYATGDGWEPLSRDSIKMAKLIKNGQQLYAVAKKDIFRLKYAYQVIRMAHYSGRFEEAVKLYDDMVTGNPTPGILQPMCLSLKAGALYRSGREKEAAYLFSKAFAMNEASRVSNYISFNWAVDSKLPRDEYLSLCKTNDERANMLALFSLSSAGDEVPAMKEILRLSPGNKALEVLAVREINKLEEFYYSPLLDKEKGGKTFYITWTDNYTDSVAREGARRTTALSEFLHVAAIKNNTANPGLYETGAAYASLMLRDYAGAGKYLENAKKMTLSPQVKDQWSLTNLLFTINKNPTIDASFEKQLLPSIQWLEQKARADTSITAGYAEVSQWKNFYRNLMSEILAKRYHQQGELHKEVLAIGAADNIFGQNDWGYSNAIDYLHNNLESKDVEKLYVLMDSKTNNSFENYLVHFNSLAKADVIDFAGTAYLRDYDYANAITWFNRSSTEKKYSIDTDAFIDLLYDQEEPLPNERATGNKLAFAKEMQRLEKLGETDQANAAKHYYKMALGFYNMTYYGHAWKLVQYYRSGSDGYYIPEAANNFQKEYYGCFKAHDYFKKAMDISADKNFKARCLFMMAKCAQKQVRQPQYSDFGSHYDQYDEAQKKYWPLFKNNKYFTQLSTVYSSTPFYKEAVTRCSYLSDFVKRK